MYPSNVIKMIMQILKCLKLVVAVKKYMIITVDISTCKQLYRRKKNAKCERNNHKCK